ncbi:MAG TPA: DNA-binding protein WhiA [Selenomonas sp.]|nr:DNA-binding protein WhiA [Selenomonadaceae bacterium]MDY3917005.1 DNA-binding protein WhiA [Selenomonadaceae bacterium]HBT80257.1 DNA-binding protein WhiA [Selenomonas sp.]
MPSFASEVKNELAHLTYEQPCDRRAELAALLRMGATVSFGRQHTFGLTFISKNAAVARKTLQLLKSQHAGLHTEITVSRSRQLNKLSSYQLRVAPSPMGTELLTQLGFLHEGSLNVESDWPILRKSCCQAAYLRGAFLGGGSVNRPEASYHLELVTGNYAFSQLLYQLLHRMQFPVGVTERKDGYVVYLKEGDAIVDFLGMLEADKAVEAFEVARNVKEVRAQVNRIVNCETANLQKAVDAAGRQLADIRLLQAAGRYAGLPELLHETAAGRLEHPEASLSELAATLHLSKPGLNHRFRKLHALAEELRQERTQE